MTAAQRRPCSLSRLWLLAAVVRTHSLHLSITPRGAALECSRRALVAMQTDTAEPETSARGAGHPHTLESRLKISAANKGKVPWNVGKKHSEETKRKIAEATRAAYLRRKAEQEQRMQEEDPEGYAAMIAKREAEAERERERKARREANAARKKAKARAARTCPPPQPTRHDRRRDAHARAAGRGCCGHGQCSIRAEGGPPQEQRPQGHQIHSRGLNSTPGAACARAAEALLLMRARAAGAGARAHLGGAAQAVAGPGVPRGAQLHDLPRDTREALSGTQQGGRRLPEAWAGPPPPLSLSPLARSLARWAPAGRPTRVTTCLGRRSIRGPMRFSSCCLAPAHRR